MDKKRIVQIGIALVCVAIICVLWFFATLRASSALGGSTNVVVLCSACSLPGLPPEGHLILLDPTNGNIWVYNDAAMAGQKKPILYGKLTLGQPIQRVK